MALAVWRSNPTCGAGTPCRPDRPAASIAVGAACDSRYATGVAPAWRDGAPELRRSGIGRGPRRL